MASYQNRPAPQHWVTQPGTPVTQNNDANAKNLTAPGGAAGKTVPGMGGGYGTPLPGKTVPGMRGGYGTPLPGKTIPGTTPDENPGLKSVGGWDPSGASGSRSEGWSPYGGGMDFTTTSTSATSPSYTPTGQPPGDPRRSSAPTQQGYTPSYSQTFGPGNNLIGTQIGPQHSGNVTTAQGWTANAAQQLANWQPSQWQGINSPDQSNAMGQFANANNMMQGLSTAGYRPVAGTDLGSARAQLGAASQGVGNSGAAGVAGMGQTGSFGYSGDTSQVRGMGLDQLKNVLNTTPDRASLANSAFQRLIDESNPQFESELRSTNAKNAAMGRRGSGMSTQDLGTVQQRREEALMRERGRLADNAAGLTLDDARSKLSAAQGYGDSLAGQDTAAGGLNLGYMNAANQERGAAFDRLRSLGNDAFGQRMSLADAEAAFAGVGRRDAMQERDAMNDAERYGNTLTGARADAASRYGDRLYGQARDTYGDMVGERDSRNQFDQQTFNNRRNVLGDLGGYEQQVRGNERSDRNELRGERDYQYGLDRDAQNDRIRQEMMQEDLYGRDFDRNRQRFDMGYSTDPYGAYNNAAGQYGQSAEGAYGAGSDMFTEWARRRARGGQGQRPSGPSGPPPNITIPDFEL